MKALRIHESGPLATVQDGGRHGWQDRGVPISGAADRQALRLANLLVGNPQTAACIEVTLGGLRAELLCDALIALAGADPQARLNGEPIACWASHRVEAGDVLTLESPVLGCRTVLSMAGGIDVPIVLGSRSTCLVGGFGGYRGRALQPGDLVECGEQRGNPLPQVPASCIPLYSDEPALRVVPGPQDDAFTEEGLAVFFSSPYEVTPRSDRMGCVLRGPEIAHRLGADIISDGVVPGAVQVPGSRQPILLMADAQTTGGYAKIATVVSFDLPLAAQLRPGSRVRFEPVSLLEARAMYLTQEYHFRKLTHTLNLLERFQSRDGVARVGRG